MSNLFEHTPTPINSPTSPVENLAEEVSQAFDTVESLIIDPKQPSPNFQKLLGSFLLLEVQKHGKIRDFNESITISANQQTALLSAIPDQITSVSFYDSISGTVKFLTEKGKTQSFDDILQYKVIGKTLHFSSNLVNRSVQVIYRGLVPFLGSLTGYSNVITQKNNATYLIEPTDIVDGISFSLVYDHDIQSIISDLFKNNRVDLNTTYLFGETSDGFVSIDFTNISITQDTVKVFSSYNLTEVTRIMIFILNTDISSFLVNLYKDYINHTHNSLETVSSIKHSDIVDTHMNTSKIRYKDVNVENYQHPQFLNREGYNPNIPELYNNALLGDLFISSLISSTDQEYKSLLKNSNAILFGDPVAGSKMYYDAEHKNITLASGSTLHGFNVNFNTSYSGFSLNNTTVFGENSTSTTIKGKNAKVEFLGTVDKESLIVVDNLEAKKTIKSDSISTNSLSFGDFIISKDGDDVVVNGGDAFFKVKNLYTDNFKAVSATIDTLKLNKGQRVEIDSNNYLTNSDDQFAFVNNKTIKIISTNKEGGVSLGSDNSNYKFYYTGSNGQLANDFNNLYIEATENSKIVLLADTSKAYTYDSKTYTYNNTVVADINIADLSKWFKSDLVVGTLESNQLVANTTTEIEKNGLKIGTTSLYVIGENVSCPEGMTVLESKDTIHFIESRSESDTSCDSLRYQQVSLGDLSIFGDIGVEGNGVFLGGITTSSDVQAKNIIVTENISTSSLSVSDNISSRFLTVREKLIVVGDIETSGNVSIRGDIEANSVELRGSLNVKQNTVLEKNLSVNGNLDVLGRLVADNGFSTAGGIESEFIKTGDITASNLELSNGLDVSGEINLAGPVSIVGSMALTGDQRISGSLDVTKDITAKSLYVLDSVIFDGRLTSIGNVELSGESIQIGTEGSKVTITGTLTLRTPITTFTGEVEVLKDFTVYGLTTLNDNTNVKGEVSAVSLVVESSANIKGSLTADSAEFTRKINLLDGLKALGISEMTTLRVESLTATDAVMDDISIKNSLTMGPDSVIKASRLEVSSIIQNDPAKTSSFVGPITTTNEVSINNSLVIGNPDIKSTRDTSGIHITDNQIKMGNNSLINAVKILAGKGVPRDGNEDRTGGFCFQSPTSLGTSDGDTGMFATIGSGAGVENSDLQFYIDGTKKGEFTSSNFSLPIFEDNKIEDPVKAKYILTYDMLLLFKQQIKEEIVKMNNEATERAYPLGTIYSNSRDLRNPSHPDLLGIGVWIPYGSGRVVVGMTSSAVGGSIEGGLTAPSDFKVGVLGTIYGEYTHKLTEAQLPKMDSRLKLTTWVHGDDAAGEGAILTAGRKWATGVQYPEGATVEINGKDEPHNNVQPTIVAARWERIA